MEILFLSTDGWRPEAAESDTVSLLINGKIMIDTGWHGVHNLLREGYTPKNVQTLLLTHLHQDHRMGLPAMLFYLLNSYQDAGSMSICGVEGVHDIVQMALEYAGKSRDYASAPAPTVRVLHSGDAWTEDGLRIETASSHHAVDGLMYKFTTSEGHTLVYTGDTAPHSDTVAFARDADVLIHEHSWGKQRPLDNPNTCGHSSAEDAAAIASEAGVGKLYIVHSVPNNRAECLTAARAIFPNTYRPTAGEKIIL